MRISVYNLKGKFQNLLMPICRKINLLGITPNQITIGTVIYTILFSIILYKFQKYNLIYLIVPIFFLVRMALNALDGMIASKFNKKTTLGVFLNEIGDLISDNVFFFCFFETLNIDYKYSLIFIFLSIISEYAGITAVQVDKKRHYEGPMGKSDRALFISILSILIFFNLNIKYLEILVVLGIILLIVTIFNRIKSSLKNVS